MRAISAQVLYELQNIYGEATQKVANVGHE